MKEDPVRESLDVITQFAKESGDAFKQAFRLEAVEEPKIMLQDIKHTLPYFKNQRFLRPTIHLGQRKLFLSELQFLTMYQPDIVLYVGAASGEKNYYLSNLFKHTKFILVDAAKFRLFVNKKKTSHRNVPVDDLVYLYTEDHTVKSLRYDHRNNTVSTITDKATVDEINSSFNKLDVASFLGFILQSEYRVFLLETMFTNEWAKIFSIFSKVMGEDDKPIKFGFISDIRTKLEGDYPSDLDVLWNQAQQYNWLKILRPSVSMFKLRQPYFEDVDKIIKLSTDEKFKAEFDQAKQNGIDFIGSYEKREWYMPYGKIYLQAWPGKSSTETRLHISRDQIDSIFKMDAKIYEDALTYYNSIDRGYIYHRHNVKADGICHCNDCAIEVTIWKMYRGDKWKDHIRKDISDLTLYSGKSIKTEPHGRLVKPLTAELLVEIVNAAVEAEEKETEERA